MAVSLNLTVGILGELSLGHAGFMSLGIHRVIAAIILQGSVSNPLRPGWSACSGSGYCRHRRFGGRRPCPASARRLPSHRYIGFSAKSSKILSTPFMSASVRMGFESVWLMPSHSSGRKRDYHYEWTHGRGRHTKTGDLCIGIHPDHGYSFFIVLNLQNSVSAGHIICP